MSLRTIRVALVTLCGLLLGTVWAQDCLAAAAEQKIALVIGNSAYPGAVLKNPVNDAKAMAAKLTGLGFEVILRTDSNFRDMTRAVSQFGQKLKGGSVGLFYFAGHGIQVRGKNFLIPVDAEIENEASTRSEALDVDQLLEQLGNARLSMVILDACRNNPFERRFRSAGNGGLAQIDAPTGTMLAYATAPGKVAYDGTGVNGLYTTELLKALDMPGLKVEDVFKQVRINVLKASDNQQIPWESSSLTGEFYFTPEVRSKTAEVDGRQSAKERAELQKALEDERRRRDQDAKIQAELQRSLEEERRKREKDAELVRGEMENLRKELLAMRQSPSAQTNIAAAATSAKAAPEAAPAIANRLSEVAATAQASPPQVAPANTVLPAKADSRANNSAWDARIALLEKMKGNLTFSKAIGTLFSLTDSEDLTLLLTFEQALKRSAWSTAYAIGMDMSGILSWASVVRFPSVAHARESSLENCNTGNARKCRVVFSNGDFLEKEFIELAGIFRDFDLNAARRSYLDSLRNPPRESVVFNTDSDYRSRRPNVFVSAAPGGKSAEPAIPKAP